MVGEGEGGRKSRSLRFAIHEPGDLPKAEAFFSARTESGRRSLLSQRSATVPSFVPERGVFACRADGDARGPGRARYPKSNVFPKEQFDASSIWSRCDPGEQPHRRLRQQLFNPACFRRRRRCFGWRRQGWRGGRRIGAGRWSRRAAGGRSWRTADGRRGRTIGGRSRRAVGGRSRWPRFRRRWWTVGGRRWWTVAGRRWWLRFSGGEWSSLPRSIVVRFVFYDRRRLVLRGRALHRA